jgi:Icc-related predicted phosphoesterase
MRLQLFSDLHVDVAPIKPIVIGDGVEAVVVPGDVCEGAHNAFVALRNIVPLTIPIVFTLGNHELYRRFYREELAAARASAPDFNVHLLENDSVVLGGVRFVGATTWTDYRIFGDSNARAAMAAARDCMNDHKRIGWRKLPWERFRPQEALMLHAQSRAYIKETIAIPHKPTVVATHHGPSMRSVPERWKSDILTSAFTSSIADDLLGDPGAAVGADSAPRVDFWFHGHIHASSDYTIGKTRVVANPHGYGGENAQFDPCLIVETAT